MRPSLLLAAVALLAGCAADPAPAPVPERPAPRLTATLEQSRNAENLHRVQVLLASDREVRVQWVQVRGGGYSEVPAAPWDQLVRPGFPGKFPVGYGTPVCDEDPDPAQVVVGTPVGELTVDVGDDPLLPRLRARDCALGRLRDAAGIAFDPAWQRRGDAALGILVVRRRGGAVPVTLTSVEGNVVFSLVPARSGPLRLAGEPAVRLPVQVRASRCDAHALIENKRTYDFPVYAALGQGLPQYVSVPVEGAGRALLDDLLRACGTAAMRSPAPAGAG